MGTLNCWSPLSTYYFNGIVSQWRSPQKSIYTTVAQEKVINQPSLMTTNPESN